MRRFLVTLTLAACTQNSGDGERDLADKVIAVRAHMHERFAASNALLTAITFGDLAAARKQAQVIADLDEPDVLPEWRPYIADVRAAAADISAAQDVMTSARGLAMLGGRCAACHEAARAQITFRAPPAPRNDGRIEGEMASHAWAASRMWEGLVTSASPPWLEGATTLERAKLTIVAEGGPFAPGIADDIARVRLYASRAQYAATREERAQVFGDLLQTCAGCHATIRGQ